MRKFIFALMACAALVGCKDQGGDFVGVWKKPGDMPETITVTKAGSGYRVLSKLDADTEGYMKVEIPLDAESNTILTTARKKKALELSPTGQVISYLRNEPGTFTKVN
jgi:hypothetical protein